MTELPRIAILGAGRVGSALARVLVDAGYDVAVAASGDPGRIALTAQILMPGARPEWAAPAIRDADIVFLAVPLHTFTSIDPALLAGKSVVDAMNYWPPVNGQLDAFDRTDLGTTEIVQAALPDAIVLKSFNHLTYHELEGDRLPGGAPNRRAIAVIGPADAAAPVAAMIDRIGFDPVLRDDLRVGRALQPGGSAFGRHLSRPALEAMLDAVSAPVAEPV